MATEAKQVIYQVLAKMTALNVGAIYARNGDMEDAEAIVMALIKEVVKIERET